MAERCCPYCGAAMTNPRRVQCGAPECARQYHNKRMREYLRQRDGFLRPYDCAHCGRRCIPGENVTRSGRFCSARCRHRWFHLNRRRTKLGPSCRVTSRPDTRRWVEGPCLECGERFIGRDRAGTVGFCTRRCQVRAKKRRHEAAKRGVGRKTLTFHTIAERDKWTCHLCGGQVDRTLAVPNAMAATLDHIIPLAFGGSHDEANVALAHFICNSRKGHGLLVSVGGQTSMV